MCLEEVVRGDLSTLLVLFGVGIGGVVFLGGIGCVEVRVGCLQVA